MAIRRDVMQEVLPENLFASFYPTPVITAVEMKENQGLIERGTLVATDEENKNGQPVSESFNAQSGAQAFYVIADPIDTDIEGNTVTTAYRQGSFQKDGLKTGDYEISEKDRLVMRTQNIHVTDSIDYPDEHIKEVEE